MNGNHTIERCEEVTGRVLQAVFDALFDQNVLLEGILLKPNMVIPGLDCPQQASAEEVAAATLRTLSQHVPPAVPAIVFLSGGQDYIQATKNLDAINELEGPKPWKLTFSYGRALQEEAMERWRGRGENVSAGQKAFYHRAKCDSAAALGRYRQRDGARSDRRLREEQSTVSHPATTRDSGLTKGSATKGNGRGGGYKERGNINTPFELAILNEVSRYHLVIDVIDRVPKLRDRAAHLKEEMRNAIIDSLNYAHEHGRDRTEIRDWTWPD